MPPMIKASYDTKALYGKCVDAFGAMGATVKKIDNGLSHIDTLCFWVLSQVLLLAVSTKMLLGGQTPALFDPSLHQNRIKRDIIVERKLDECTEGLGIEGLRFESSIITHFC
jgi:hypothetical protein